jgi:chromatin remodeling complex protein RSC6
MAEAKGLAKPMKLSPELEAIVGAGPMPRTEVTKKLWVYIRDHKLQDPDKKTEIKPDATLGKVIGTDTINMFAMTSKVSGHIFPMDGAAKAA